MPTQTVLLTTFSGETRGGSSTNWQDHANAELSDDARASYNPAVAVGGSGSTNFLQGVGLQDALPADLSTLNSITVVLECTGHANTVITTPDVHLVKGGTILTGVNGGDATQWGAGDTVRQFEFDAANLATLGIVPSDLAGLAPSDFGCAFGMDIDDTESGGGNGACDQMYLIFDFEQGTTSSPGLKPHHWAGWPKKRPGFKEF